MRSRSLGWGVAGALGPPGAQGRLRPGPAWSSLTRSSAAARAVRVLQRCPPFAASHESTGRMGLPRVAEQLTHGAERVDRGRRTSIRSAPAPRNVPGYSQRRSLYRDPPDQAGTGPGGGRITRRGGSSPVAIGSRASAPNQLEPQTPPALSMPAREHSAAKGDAEKVVTGRPGRLGRRMGRRTGRLVAREHTSSAGIHTRDTFGRSWARAGPPEGREGQLERPQR